MYDHLNDKELEDKMKKARAICYQARKSADNMRLALDIRIGKRKDQFYKGDVVEYYAGSLNNVPPMECIVISHHQYTMRTRVEFDSGFTTDVHSQALRIK